MDLLLSMSRELEQVSTAENEQIAGLKKEKTDLVDEEKKLSRELETLKKKIQDINGKIAKAENDKNNKVNELIEMCQKNGLAITN